MPRPGAASHVTRELRLCARPGARLSSPRHDGVTMACYLVSFQTSPDPRHDTQKIFRRWQLADVLRVRVDVDESGRDDVSEGVDLRRRRSFHVTDSHDAPALHRDAAGDHRRA